MAMDSLVFQDPAGLVARSTLAVAVLGWILASRRDLSPTIIGVCGVAVVSPGVLSGDALPWLCGTCGVSLFAAVRSAHHRTLRPMLDALAMFVTIVGLALAGAGALESGAAAVWCGAVALFGGLIGTEGRIHVVWRRVVPVEGPPSDAAGV